MFEASCAHLHDTGAPRGKNCRQAKCERLAGKPCRFGVGKCGNRVRAVPVRRQLTASFRQHLTRTEIFFRVRLTTQGLTFPSGLTSINFFCASEVEYAAAEITGVAVRGGASRRTNPRITPALDERLVSGA